MSPQHERSALWAQAAEVLQAESRLSSVKAWAQAEEGDRLAEDLGVDSIGQLYLVLALEAGFQLKLEDPEASAESLKTVGQVLDWLQGQAHQAP